MRIEVQYEVSDGNHPIDFPQHILEQMVDSGKLSYTEEVGNKGNTKTSRITGTNKEKWLLAQALLKSMDV